MDKQTLDKIVKTLIEKYKKEGRLTYDDVNAEIFSSMIAMRSSTVRAAIRGTSFRDQKICL